ncbi:MAG: shikimate dehydrogenase [Candidatus Limnocylindrales bacterium]
MTSYVALLGDPVAGNPTSQMQNAAFRSAGLDWWYLDIRVEAGRLGDAVQAARVLRFGGLNLTTPHKIAVIPLLDGLERSAEISGAVNTVRLDPDGGLIGLNTDGLGFLHALRDAKVDPAGTTVVLLGAGGAARAVAVELALAGVARIVVASRSAGRREELVSMIVERTPAQSSGLDWPAEPELPPCDLLVHCTPIGMGTGEPAERVPPVRLEALSPETVVCDLNPDRAESAFLRKARTMGHRTLGGLPMLARQGAAGFEAWTGHTAPLQLMIDELEQVTGGTGEGTP